MQLVAIAVAGIVAALVLVPLAWPVPPLEDTVSPESLADSDARFIEIDGLSVHCKAWGFPSSNDLPGVDTAFLLLHGFGASVFSWQTVASQLSARMPVLAFDRPGYGLTERPLTWAGTNPYSPDAQAEMAVRLMDHFGIGRAVVVGHSAGGTVAALLAARHPERVAAVILEDPAIFAGGPPAFLTPLFRTPQMKHLGPLIARNLGGKAGTDFIRSAWHDPSRITEETYQGYRTPLRVHDWDRALWQVTLAPRPSDVPGVMAGVAVPALFITGDDDRIVPPADTGRAAELVEGARLVTIAQCGHIAHEERPTAFIEAVDAFVDEALGAGAPAALASGPTVPGRNSES